MSKIKKHLDFENIESKFEKTLELPEYKKFLEDFNSSKQIFVIANGGLWAVANHAADDCNRLFHKEGVDKIVHSMDSACMITSIANDYGWNNLFIKWLEIYIKKNKSSDIMVVGLSCSGGSKNVISALHWAKNIGCKTGLVSGYDAKVLPEDINQVCLDTKYFHTTEVLTLIMFYELIHACGAECPTIKEEVVRKSVSQPISRPLS
jgi:phosphoheptose isomerase|tara:strand:+ start:31186 stop:31803 length:618 start_codon:yes stop_codon:yes gene_type:complete